MKLKYLGILSAATLAFSGSANAELLFDLYAGATVGAGAATEFADDATHTDSAQSYGAVLGLDIPLVRFELEYDYLNNDSARLHMGMINLYGKIPSTVVHPYLGVGVGNVFGGDAHDLDVDSAVAYQGMLGVTFDVPVLPIKIDAEGRAIYIPNLYQVADIKPDLLQYEVRLKLRYVF